MRKFYSALAIADRVYVLETGKVVHECRTCDIVGDPTSLTCHLGVQ